MNIISRLFLIICIFTTYPAFSQLQTTKTIQIGGSPGQVDITPDGKKVYVTNSTLDFITVIDIPTNSVIKTINVGNTPNDLEINPDGSEVYVTNRSGNSISIIDTTSDTVVDTIPLGDFVDNVNVTPDGSKIYVSSAEVRAPITLFIIDAQNRTVSDTIVTTHPHGPMVFSPDGNTGYLGLQVQGDTIVSTAVIDLNTNNVITEIPDVKLFLVTSDGKYGWGSHQFDDTVSYVDLINNTIISSTPAAARPRPHTFSLDGSLLYMTNDDSNLITVIDTATNTVCGIIPQL